MHTYKYEQSQVDFFEETSKIDKSVSNMIKI